MKLYAQQGYGTGNGINDRIIAGLSANYIDGAILSPKDYGAERAILMLDRMRDEFSHADRFFDPQYYACVLAHDPSARMGKLLSDGYSYFQPRRRAQLEREMNVIADLDSCLRFQAQLDVTAAIAPGIVIRQRFDSVEGAIAKSFIRNARQVWSDIGDERPLYVTLAVDADALQDRHELEDFLSDITILDSPPDGFYLLIHNPTSEIAPELIDPRTLAGWMLLNHSLNLNGFEVVNGFSDMLTPILSASGAAAGATGWFNTQKVFSLDRFSPPSTGGRRPVFRYLSKGLLNSIRFDELQRLRMHFPQVLNGLNSDTDYDEDLGSEPNGQLEEILQTWDTISSFEDPDLIDCLEWIDNAKQLYDQINLSPGMRLAGRSNGDHLDALRGGIELFAELAEIEL